MFNSQLLICVKNFIEKDPTLANDLIFGLLKFWPITCPPKEVVFISVIEEVVEFTLPSLAFTEYGPALLKRLILTS